MSWWSRLTLIFKQSERIVADPMKYLIVGLGNMGAEYDDTRHNVGFDVVDFMAKAADTTFKNDNLGDLARIKYKGRTLVLLKPSTFMNRSGKAVRYWMQKEKINKDRVLVIVDDLNLDFGKQRLRGKGSDGGHNGLKDIDQMTGGNNYARLRIGIGNDFHKGQQVDYVLGEWTPQQKEQLPEIFQHAAQTVQAFATIGLNHTMSQYNR